MNNAGSELRNDQAAQVRYHGLDALRAAMMLLGIVVHGVMAYSPFLPVQAWTFRDPSTSILFDTIGNLIHVFRMPTFFVVAGFFAALLYYRRGLLGMVNNRMQRVLLPLIAAWLLLNPVVALLAQFAAEQALQVPGAKTETNAWTDAYQNTMHFWFLHHLVLFVLMSAAFISLSRHLNANWHQRIVTFVERSPLTQLELLIGALVIAILLWPNRLPLLGFSIKWLPQLDVLSSYFVFYLFGWSLFLRRDQLHYFDAHLRKHTLLATICVVIWYGLFGWIMSNSETSITTGIISRIVLGLAIWYSVWAWLGVFLRYFSKPSKLVRYFSDASYWIYLVHLPLVVILQALLVSWDVPAMIKVLIVILATAAATTITYQFFVRSTFLGVFLNGRRY